MSGKGKRRREARRRARQRREDQPAERPPLEEGVAAEAEGDALSEDVRREEPAQAAAEARHSRAARKRAKQRDIGPWERVRSLRVPPWLIVTPVMVIGVGVLAYFILSSGSSGVTGGGPSSSPTPDPRVAGLTPDVSFDINAGGETNDAFFSPDTVTASAGDVVEFVVTNIGSVSHNLRLAGLDDEYDTADDFEMPPNVVLPGETQRLVVKLDQPGTYRFRCDFHPLVQTGTLELQ